VHIRETVSWPLVQGKGKALKHWTPTQQPLGRDSDNINESDTILISNLLC
jgi:hypothetical protein